MRKRGTGQRELRTDGFSAEPAGVRHFLIWGDKWNSVTKKSVSHTSDHACPMRSVYGWGGGRNLTVSTLSFPFSTFLPFPLLHPLLLCQFLLLFSPSFPSPVLKFILLKLCVYACLFGSMCSWALLTTEARKGGRFLGAGLTDSCEPLIVSDWARTQGFCKSRAHSQLLSQLSNSFLN